MKYADLQIPIRQQDLISVSKFISHCSDFGVRTDKKELEFFEEQRVFFPVVRVSRGFAEFKRILLKEEDKEVWKYVFPEDLDKFDVLRVDKKKYYSRGGFSLGGKNWLKFYEDQNMVLYPAQEKFKDWKSFKPKELELTDFLTDTSEKEWEHFYDPLQVYLLKELQLEYKLNVRNRSIICDKESWESKFQNLEKFFNPETLRERGERKNRHWIKIIGLIHSLKDLEEKHQKYAVQEFKKFRESIGEEKSNQQDIDGLWGLIDSKFSPKIKSIIKKYSLDDEKFKDLSNFFLSQASIKRDDVFLKTVLMLTKKLRGKSRNEFSRTIERYVGKLDFSISIFNLFNWAIEVQGERLPLLDTLARASSSQEICPYCHKRFEPKRKDSVTCGDEECKKKHSRESIKIGREKGIYQMNYRERKKKST